MGLFSDITANFVLKNDSPLGILGSKSFLGEGHNIPESVMVAVDLRFFPSCVKEQKTAPDTDGSTSVFILRVLADVLCSDEGNTDMILMQEEVHSTVVEYTPATLGGRRVGLPQGEKGSGQVLFWPSQVARSLVMQEFSTSQLLLS